MENNLPVLNLPPCGLRVREREGIRQVWDSLRRQWLVLTPEEWVRQNFIGFLRSGMGVPPQHIAQECPVPLGGPQRADIVVYGCDGKACLLVECKEPGVDFETQTASASEPLKAAMSQAVRYNSVISAPYIILTNGKKHLCFAMEGSRPKQMAEFPDLSPFFRV